MQMERAITTRNMLVISTLFGVLAVGGCRSKGSTNEAQEQSVTKTMKGMGGTGEAGAGGAIDQLDFFDAMEHRSTVTWDELLAGVLLAAGRRADGAYADRLAVARRTGILSTETPTSGDALASPGDLAKVLLRSQGIQLRNTISGEEAISLAARRSLMPATLAANGPLTGAVTVRALAAVGQPVGASGTTPPKTIASPPPKPPTSGSQP